MNNSSRLLDSTTNNIAPQNSDRNPKNRPKRASLAM